MTQALTIYTDAESKFPILKDDLDSLKLAFEAFRTNMGSRRLSIRNLQQVKMPSGGSTTWQFPTLSGIEDRKEIECVLVGQGTPRVYWGTEFGKGEKGAPPDCVSPDGITGIGLYGADGIKGAEGPNGSRRRIPGDCATCPMNQWPSRSEQNRKKPCSELRNLFFLTQGEDSILPRYVRITPGSLSVIDDFMVQLGGMRIPYFAAVVKLSLTKQTNRAGIPYAQAKLEFVGKLTVEEAMKMRVVAESVAHLLGDTSVERSDVEGGGMPSGTVEGQYETVD